MELSVVYKGRHCRLQCQQRSQGWRQVKWQVLRSTESFTDSFGLCYLTWAALARILAPAIESFRFYTANNCPSNSHSFPHLTIYLCAILPSSSQASMWHLSKCLSQQNNGYFLPLPSQPNVPRILYSFIPFPNKNKWFV